MSVLSSDNEVDILASKKDRLPEGWEIARLEEISTPPQYGWTTSADNDNNDLKLLRTSDISKGSVDWSTVPGCKRKPDNLSKYLLSAGDILVSRAGSVGLSYVVKECPESIFASYLIRFKVLPPIDTDFIGWYLKSPQYWSAIADETAGIAIPNVNASKLKKLGIPLPPLSEQKRIVLKIEELLARVNVVSERLANVKEILKRFRQSVLTTACSGRLTADWRERNRDVEPARYFLEKLQPEVLGQKNRGRKVVAKQLDPEPFQLPPKWEWASVSDLCISVTDGDHQPPPKSDNGVPFVVISNISSGSLNLSQTMFVPPDYYAGLSESRKPQRGDILYSVTGSYGIPVLIDTDREFCFQRHIALLRPHQAVSASYFFHAMSSQLVYKQATAVATGIAQLTVPLSGLRALRVPVPPYMEQEEIASRVQGLFKLANTIEKHVKVAAGRSDKLTQAILVKAFSGELVETEAELARREGRSYEPASAALKGIRIERETNEVSKSKPRRMPTGKSKRRSKRKPKVEYRKDEKHASAKIELSRFSKLKVYQALSENARHLLHKIEELIGDREFSTEEIKTLTDFDTEVLKNTFFELIKPFPDTKNGESPFIKMKFIERKGSYVYTLARGE